MTTRSAWSLPLVPASFFGIVLGLIGLGNPWRVAVRLWGLPSLPGELIMLAGVLVWAVVTMLFSAKWIWSRDEALAEAVHPIQCCFIGLAGVATMMVAIAAEPYDGRLAEVFFLSGLLFTAAFAVWRAGGLLMGNRPSGAVTPVLYVPIVAGGFVAANAASLLDYSGIAQLAFGAAFFSWLSIEPVLLHRLFTGSPVEPALRPTLVIQLTPATVGGVAAVNVLGDQWSILPVAMLGYATLQALILVRLMPWIAGKSFAPGYWGSAFGATAFAMLALRLAEKGQFPIAREVAPWLFAGANLVVAFLVAGSVGLLTRKWLVTLRTQGASPSHLLSKGTSRDPA